MEVALAETVALTLLDGDTLALALALPVDDGETVIDELGDRVSVIEPL